MFNFLRRTSLYLLAIPALILFMGIASNQAVLITNHDRFPVLVNETKIREFQAAQEEAADEGSKLSFTAIVARAVTPHPVNVDADGTVMIDEVHCVMTKQSHLKALADIFDMRSIYSIGDFMLYLGGWMWSFAPLLFVFDVTRKLCKAEREYYERYQ